SVVLCCYRLFVWLELVDSVFAPFFLCVFFFFFQAEDGIRDRNVPGVQTCALPICRGPWAPTHTCSRPARRGQPRRRHARGPCPDARCARRTTRDPRSTQQLLLVRPPPARKPLASHGAQCGKPARTRGPQ